MMRAGISIILNSQGGKVIEAGKLLKSSVVAVALMISVVGSANSETFWLSEPGYCSSDFAVIEDNDVMVLNKAGISTHWFSCDWPEDVGQAILRGEDNVTTKADCANATETWSADLEIITISAAYLRVDQKSGGLSPVKFFRCEIE